MCSVWSPGDYSEAAPYTMLHLATTRVTINAENRMNECVSCSQVITIIVNSQGITWNGEDRILWPVCQVLPGVSLTVLTQAGGGEGGRGGAGVASVPPLAGGHHGVGARASHHQRVGHTHRLGHPDLAGVLPCTQSRY